MEMLRLALLYALGPVLYLLCGKSVWDRWRWKGMVVYTAPFLLLALFFIYFQFAA